MERFELVSVRRLADRVNEYVVYAPEVARHCKAGQFVILRVDEDGERVPFTVCDYSREEGTVCILVQEVGYTTLAAEGRPADIVVGARNESLLIYQDEFRRHARDFYPVTDDGSNGRKGFVTDIVRELLESGKEYDVALAVGPLPMMRAVCDLTREFSLPTVVSMNPVMVDGTGMCGCCRLTVGGEVKYACIDGPEFDGHKVDFDEAMQRLRTYKAQEEEHMCRLRGERR